MMIQFPKTTDTCIFCSSKRVHAFSQLKSGVNHYRCYDCKRCFSPTRKIIPGMTYSADMFDMVIELSESGLSSYKICDKISKIYAHSPNDATIRRWLRNYKNNPIWQKHYKKYVSELQRRIN